MKLWDIVKTVGSAVVETAVPGGSLIIRAVNEFLSDDDKLPVTATGNDVAHAVNKLPAEQQAILLTKEFNIKKEQIVQSYSTIRTMLESDASNPHTTRPYIAKGAFHVIAFAVIAVISIFSYGVAVKDSEMVSAMTNGWPFVLSVLGPLVILLHAYFGVLRKEQQNKLNAANHLPAQSTIATITNRIISR